MSIERGQGGEVSTAHVFDHNDNGGLEWYIQNYNEGGAFITSSDFDTPNGNWGVSHNGDPSALHVRVPRGADELPDPPNHKYPYDGPFGVTYIEDLQNGQFAYHQGEFEVLDGFWGKP